MTTENPQWWSNHWRQYLQRGNLSFRDHSALIYAADSTLKGFTGKRVLEVGSGRGIDSIRMAQRGAKAVTVDFTQESAEIIKLLKRGVAIYSVIAHGDNLPFADNTFDLVFSQGLLDNSFHNSKSLVKEQARVVKSGGFVLIEVPNLLSLQTPTREFQKLFGSYPYTNEHPYSYSSLRALVEGAGLEVVNFYGRGLIPMVFIPYDSWIRRTIIYNRPSQTHNSSQRVPDFGFFTKYIENGIGKFFLNNIGVIAQRH